MENKNYKMRNSSIDLFRYVCAILVVAIHTHPFSEVNEEVGYFATNVITRIGVPFFFAIAGYYYIQKLEVRQEVFVVCVKRLVSTYFLWSLIYFAIDFINWGYLNLKGFAIESVYQFIVTGSYYHFWFFPALIFSIIFSTFLYKIKCEKVLIPLSIILYIVGCLGCSYYELGIQIPGLKDMYLAPQFNYIRRFLLMGFPYFVSGYLVYRLKCKYAKCSKGLVLICAAVWLFEIYLVRTLGVENNIIITFGLYPLIVVLLLFLFDRPLLCNRSISNYCKSLANFTYFSHPLFILCILTVGGKVLHIDIGPTPLFLLTVLTTLLFGVIIHRVRDE